MISYCLQGVVAFALGPSLSLLVLYLDRNLNTDSWLETDFVIVAGEIYVPASQESAPSKHPDCPLRFRGLVYPHPPTRYSRGATLHIFPQLLRSIVNRCKLHVPHRCPRIITH
jgi:hypothetical protein